DRAREVERRAAADVPRGHRRRRRRDDGQGRLLHVQARHGLAQQRIPGAEDRASDRQERAREADEEHRRNGREVTATLGRFLILASLLVSTLGAMISYAAGRKHAPEGVRWAQRFAYVYAALMVGAALVMEYALLAHDFSVGYVAHVRSHTRSDTGTR